MVSFALSELERFKYLMDFDVLESLVEMFFLKTLRTIE